MDAHRFDALARLLGGGLSRRQAVKLAVMGAVGAAFGRSAISETRSQSAPGCVGVGYVCDVEVGGVLGSPCCEELICVENIGGAHHTCCPPGHDAYWPDRGCCLEECPAGYVRDITTFPYPCRPPCGVQVAAFRPCVESAFVARFGPMPAALVERLDTIVKEIEQICVDDPGSTPTEFRAAALQVIRDYFQSWSPRRLSREERWNRTRLLAIALRCARNSPRDIRSRCGARPPILIFPTETATVSPTEVPTDAPAETPTNTPTETPTSTPTSTPTQTASPTETMLETPTNPPTAVPTEEATSTSIPTPDSPCPDGTYRCTGSACSRCCRDDYICTEYGTCCRPSDFVCVTEDATCGAICLSQQSAWRCP